MGLDMYLLLQNKETKETVEYSYYRNFNALQGYFERQFNLDNGGVVLLSSENIDTIYDILNTINCTSERAEELLPTYADPFFGSYEYDHLYFSYISKATSDFYHAKFINYDKYNLYFTSDW